MSEHLAVQSALHSLRLVRQVRRHRPAPEVYEVTDTDIEAQRPSDLTHHVHVE